MAQESSFLSGMKGAFGVIAALVLLFIVAPCAMCSGLTMCGGAMEGYQEAADRADSAASDNRSGTNRPSSSSSEQSAEEDDNPEPTGKWNVRTTASDMDDSLSVILSLESENQIEDWVGFKHRGVLIVRCVENKTSAILRTGMNANPEVGNYGKAHARIRLDDKDADRVNLSESTDGEALFFPGSTKYPREFSGHQRMRFEFTPFQQSRKMYEFDLTGYDEVLPQVQEACNWD